MNLLQIYTKVFLLVSVRGAGSQTQGLVHLHNTLLLSYILKPHLWMQGLSTELRLVSKLQSSCLCLHTARLPVQLQELHTWLQFSV